LNVAAIISSIVNFIVPNWPYFSLGCVGLAALLLRRRLLDSERRAAAEKEQTFFLAILYIIMKSGKTFMNALAEAARRREIVNNLSREAAFLLRNAEKTTLTESFSKYVHPSREFSLLIGSIGEDVASGFGVVEKLEKQLEQSIMRERERWERYVGTVETLGEAIVSIILLIPLVYVVGSIFGGFPSLYIVVLILGAAAVFYVLAASSEPMHVIDLPRWVVVSSSAAVVAGGAILLSFYFFPSLVTPFAVGLALTAWGLFVHFRYVRVAVSEGEASFLLLDGVAARLRAGYPVGRSLEAVADPRYARFAKAIARGLSLEPFNRFMRIAVETVKLARLGGLGSEALSLMSRLAITIYLSFVNARARMKLYDALAIGSGAAIIAISAFTILPFTSLPPELSQEVQRLMITPSLEPILGNALLVAFTLGVAVSKAEDQTIAAAWRAGAGLLLTLAAYVLSLGFIQPTV